ncbi:MAG: YraN family protein, partial [Acidimicrobiia bacterium]
MSKSSPNLQCDVSLTGNALGRAGEDIVLHHYERRGYSLIERNWRAGTIGELDLIFERGVGRERVIVFCEVKTRASRTHELGLAAISTTKVRRMRALIGVWLEAHPQFGA